MGNHAVEVAGLPPLQDIKVHARMCTELFQFVVKISKVLPEIEEARPRWSAGIQSLCLLSECLLKAKFLLQQCSESSVLYLALTGEATLARCRKFRNLFDQSLNQIQNMVPNVLAVKISKIVAELRSAEFRLDPSEAEAGKVLQELLRRSAASDFDKEAALNDIHNAALWLHITSQRALLLERRSIKKMVDNLGESDSKTGKKRILLFFLDLLKKYGKNMPLEKRVNGPSDLVHPLPFASPYHFSREVELSVDYRPNEAEIGMLSRPILPEEFICPLSFRLMSDPVVIASGITYERLSIQKRFDEGNDICPKTGMKLPHLLCTSNTGMKDLITKWCVTHSITPPEPTPLQTPLQSWETSSNSISSITSSMYNLNLPVDFSNVSLGSCQDSDHTNSIGFSKPMKPLHEDDMELLSKFSEIPWDSRRIVVEDVKKLLKHCNESQFTFPLEQFAQLIHGFLKDAYDLRDVEAQMTGCLLLLEFVQKNGDSTPSYINQDIYKLLASFLDTQLSEQALSILVVLSSQPQCCLNIVSSGAVTHILNRLDSQIYELVEPALHILSNLSSNEDIHSIIPSKSIIKLIPLFEDDTLARHCIAILKNMPDAWFLETEGCIASIVKVLEIDDCGAQEDALSILLRLCSQRVEYCKIVMDEGVFANLLGLTINASNEGKAAAMELFRILKGVSDSSGDSCNADAVVEMNKPQPERDSKSCQRPSGFLGKVFGKKRK